MRGLLIVAAVALLYAAGPADAATKRAGAPRAVPKAKCVAAKAAAKRATKLSRRAAARRRALLRRCAASKRVRVGESGGGLIGMPGALAAPIQFAAPQPASGDPAAPSPAPTPAPEAPILPPIYSNPYAVQVQGFEFGLQLSKAAVSAGDVRVEFNLARAEDPHNLWLVREDGTGTAHSFDEEPSGAVVAKMLPLTRGRWKLFCSLSGHEAAGMRATLTVD
jgi:plastocyanin